MARRRLVDVDHPDTSLTDAFWLQFGEDPQPPMRLKILYITLGEVAKSGPGSFNVASVCDRLGITYPMVNHYFGGRDGLLAEGAVMRYRMYVDALAKAAAEPLAPEDRLRAWIFQQLRDTIAMGGWAPILNYQLSAREVNDIINDRFRTEMNDLFQLNLARLGSLILDIRAGECSKIDFITFPKNEMLADPALQALAPLVAWSTFGLSVWVAGSHAPARDIPEVSMMSHDLIENHVSLLIDTIKNWKEN